LPGLWPLGVVPFSLPFLGCFSFNKVWQGFINSVSQICLSGRKIILKGNKKLSFRGKGVTMFSHLTFGTFMLVGIFEEKCALDALDILGFDQALCLHSWL